MSDTTALARLIFAKTRNQVIGCIAWIFVCVAIAILAGALFGQGNVMPVLCMMSLPVLLWSLAMFETGQTENLLAGGSAYSHWMLRMPIANWKLAFTPLAMRFIWITFYYGTLVLIAGIYGGWWFPIPTGLMLFFAGGAWVSAITWRPFRGQWQRLGAIVLSVLLYYLLFAAVMSVHFDGNTDIIVLRNHPQLVKTLVVFLTVAALIAGVWLALSSIALARTESRGRVPETKTALAGWLGRLNSFLSPDASQVIMHRDRRAALVWHDLRRMLLLSERWNLFLMVAGLTVCIAILPLPMANAIFLMFLFSQMGVMGGSMLLEKTDMHGSSLPPYIAASPLTCAEIGFGRGLTGVWTSYLGTGLVGSAYLVCLALPYNQVFFGAWFKNMNTIYESPFAAYRWMALIVAVCIAVVPSRSLGFTWPTMTGRSRLALVALVLPIAVLLASGAAITGWFLVQTDWESAIANAWYWAAWIPTMLVVLLAIKFTASSIATLQSTRNGLISANTVTRIIVVWAAATLLIAGVFHALIPDTRLLFVWTLMVTALILPLGRILILPYAVYLNRYR